MRAGDVVPDQPRRRITDKDRRRWSDDRLDDFRHVTERRLEDLEAFERLVSQVPALMQGVKEQLEQTQKDVRELRQENRQAHSRVESKTDEIKQTVTPGRLDWALKFATVVSLILVPILAAWVARGGP